MAERPEEVYVRNLFDQRFGVRLRKVPEAATKTPDYELIGDGEAVAVLEVKAIKPVAHTPENGWTKTALGFWTRVDNSPQRVANDIHKACKQLHASALPKILTFVNEDGLDVMDLEDAFHGGLYYGNQTSGYYFNSASGQRGAVKRIADEKNKIDLFIWVDRYGGLAHDPQCRFVTEVGCEVARRWFGVPETPRHG